MICIELGGVIEIAKENAHQTFSSIVFKVRVSHLILVFHIRFLGMELLTLCWKNFISAYLPAKEYRYVSMQPILDGGRLERRETHDRGEKYTHRYTEKYTRKYKIQGKIQHTKAEKANQCSGFLIIVNFKIVAFLY